MSRLTTIRQWLRGLVEEDWVWLSVGWCMLALVLYVLVLKFVPPQTLKNFLGPATQSQIEYAPPAPPAPPETVIWLPRTLSNHDQRLTPPCLQDNANWGATRYRSCWTYEADTYRGFVDCLRRWEVACDGTR